MKSRVLTIAFALSVVLAGPVTAQTLFSARGLGFPVDPSDARARALGGVSLGFVEPEISWDNPAAAVGIASPGFIVGYQYANADASIPGATANVETARFPLILGAFPIGERIAVVAGYGDYLDQNWRIERPDSLVVGTDSLEITDIASSDGGVARIRAGAAYQLFPSLAISAALDFYTGSIERIEGRLFPEQAAPICCRSVWNYDGIGYTAAIKWSPSPATGVGLSVSHGGTLDADVESGVSQPASFDLPNSLNAGATARVAESLLVALGGRWTGWSSVEDDVAERGGARDGWMAGAGLEYDGILIGERRFPLRLGARTEALPFQWATAGAEDWADERAVTFGLGALLAGGAVRSDVAFDIGDRTSDNDALDESFWRFTLSVRVIGR